MVYRRFKRWLYRGNRPHFLARTLNRGWAALHARGIAPGSQDAPLEDFEAVAADYPVFRVWTAS